MSNVKAGDLAIVVGHRIQKANGRIVEVLEVAPRGLFKLPDGSYGYVDHDEQTLCWIVKYIGGPGPINLPDGIYLGENLYRPFADPVLRPLPGDESITTTDREVTA